MSRPVIRYASTMKLEELQANAVVRGIPGEDSHRVHYPRHPFQSEPDFGASSVNYSFAELLKRAEPPD